MDAFLSMAHWWAVLGMVAVLGVELASCRGSLDRAGVARLAKIDGAYGALAGLVLVAGFARAFLGAKGWSFYGGNPVFWVKIGLFVSIGLLSIRPTVAFIRWRKELGAGGGVIDGARTAAMRRWVHAELMLLALIPVAAALMARGIGY
ncbi:MAG: DUF2214 family protein [Lautropia sp.]